MSQTLRSRFPHLRVLLERHGAPQPPEHLIESYQQDRFTRGLRWGRDLPAGIACIFFYEREYNHARERIREALPLADACGLLNVVASLALLWADIDLAAGKTNSATHLADHGTEQ